MVGRSLTDWIFQFDRDADSECSFTFMHCNHLYSISLDVWYIPHIFRSYFVQIVILPSPALSYLPRWLTCIPTGVCVCSQSFAFLLYVSVYGQWNVCTYMHFPGYDKKKIRYFASLRNKIYCQFRYDIKMKINIF